MQISANHLIATALIIILLIAANLYQFQNPKVIEVPTEQTAIDSTAWVTRSAYADRETIIDSLRSQNQAMAERIRKQADQIASYTNITGRLKLQVDSLEQSEQIWNAIPLMDRLIARDSAAIVDTTFKTSKTFGDGLLRVIGIVEFIQGRFRQDFTIAQLRPIRLDVVSTMNEDRSRILTYVTSPDFEDLKYRSFTELKPQKKIPWFWIGVGTGAAGALILLN